MALYGALAEAVRKGEAQDRGTATVTAGGVVTVTANIKNITNIQLTPVYSASPALTPSIFTAYYSGSGKTFQIFSWQATSAGGATLVTGSTSASVYWMADGISIPVNYAHP